MCVYICIYLSIYLSLYIYTHVYTYIHIYIYIYIYTPICTHVHAHNRPFSAAAGGAKVRRLLTVDEVARPSATEAANPMLFRGNTTCPTQAFFKSGEPFCKLG